ncbi:MAG TPA: hypothetical protein PKV34_05345 [Thermomonas sp.]|mgnify:CR=1 FL=1|jgi:hypothetical protein|nr:hypothetical protein [Thermomonas sp.]
MSGFGGVSGLVVTVGQHGGDGVKEYFELQCRMVGRRFRDAGLAPLLACVVLGLAFVGFSIVLFRKTEFAEYVYVCSVLMLVGRLSESRRSEFLEICFGDAGLRKVRVVENLVCSSPFIVFLLCRQFFLMVVVLLVAVVILALVRFRARLDFVIWTPFSKKPFEFSTGFRNTFYLILMAYALAFVAVSAGNFNLGVFAMLLVFAIVSSYYTKLENEYYVWTYGVNARGFLLGKMKMAMLFSSSLALPVALLLTVFFHRDIGMISLFFLAGLAFLVCVIVSKYSAYPNEMNIAQGIPLGLCLWFPPLLLVLVPCLFWKSEKRLGGLLK